MQLCYHEGYLEVNMVIFEILLFFCRVRQQDRQLAKIIFFLAKNFGESRHFSHNERIRVVTCRQLLSVGSSESSVTSLTDDKLVVTGSELTTLVVVTWS